MKPDRSPRSGFLWVWVVILWATTIACSFATDRLVAIRKLTFPVSGRIAYVGMDGNIYSIDQNGQQQNAVTTDAGGAVQPYQFPAWSPDSRRISFLGIRTVSGSSQSASVYTAAQDGTSRVEVFKSSEEIPFYFYWSPNGQFLSFLASLGENQGLNFHLIQAMGGEDRLIGMGSPFYWDWSPDSRTIFVHVGGDARNNPDARLSFLTLDPRTEQKLDLRPGYFQAPAWSPDGRALLISAETDGGQDALLLLKADGSVDRTVDISSGPYAFGWSADGGKVAYLAPKGTATQGFFRALKLYDHESQQSIVIDPEDEVMAFFWSPDSKKIAYFVPVRAPQPGGSQGISQTTPSIVLRLSIYDLGSGSSFQVTSFVPTDGFLSIIPFFDQYQHSAAFWSPDSQSLVVSALDQASNPGIYVLSATGGRKMRHIAAGSLAIWSWK